MSKDQIEHEVSGPQPVTPVPEIPQTAADFQQLLENPEKPAQNQASPSQESLNPHLIG